MAFAIADVKQMTDLSGVDSNGVKYSQLYYVYFTGQFDSVALLYNTDGRLPKRLDDHRDANAFCEQVTIQVIDNDSPNPGAGQQSLASYLCVFAQKNPNFAANPLSRPAVIRWGGTDITETVKKDYEGTPIRNSAKDMYDGLPERPIPGAECSITRNESKNPAATIANYSYSANDSDTFVVGGVAQVGAENGLMGKIEAQKQNELYQGSIVTYWQVTYPIRFRRDGWRLFLLDHGMRFLDGAGKQQVHEDDHANGCETLLDGSGHVLAVGANPVNFPAAGFQIHKPMNWAALSLPNPFS